MARSRKTIPTLKGDTAAGKASAKKAPAKKTPAGKKPAGKTPAGKAPAGKVVKKTGKQNKTKRKDETICKSIPFENINFALECHKANEMNF